MIQSFVVCLCMGIAVAAPQTEFAGFSAPLPQEFAGFSAIAEPTVVHAVSQDRVGAAQNIAPVVVAAPAGKSGRKYKIEPKKFHYTQ